MCPALSDSVECDYRPCLEDCLTSTWSAWSSCSSSCSKIFGVKQRVRIVSKPAAPSGAPCPELYATTTCKGRGTCPQDCMVTDWDKWSHYCDAKCEVGQLHRKRFAMEMATDGGEPCGALEQSVPCSLAGMPCTDCILSAWFSWGPCTQACGGGKKYRSRSVVTRAVGVGQPCSSLIDAQHCADHPCTQTPTTLDPTEFAQTLPPSHAPTMSVPSTLLPVRVVSHVGYRMI